MLPYCHSTVTRQEIWTLFDLADCYTNRDEVPAADRLAALPASAAKTLSQPASCKKQREVPIMDGDADRTQKDVVRDDDDRDSLASALSDVIMQEYPDTPEKDLPSEATPTFVADAVAVIEGRQVRLGWMAEDAEDGGAHVAWYIGTWSIVMVNIESNEPQSHACALYCWSCSHNSTIRSYPCNSVCACD